MGKGSLVRASRQVTRRQAPAPPAGAAFGVGALPRIPTDRRAPKAQVDARVDGVPGPERAWRAAVRVTKALPRLEELAAALADARRVVEGLEEEIAVAVDHLRVDGASWVQIGRALGISRQGARQRFGGASGAHRTRQIPSDPHSFDR